MRSLLLFASIIIPSFASAGQNSTGIQEKTGSDLTIEADKITCERDKAECVGEGHVKVVKTPAPASTLSSSGLTRGSASDKDPRVKPEGDIERSQTLTANHMKVSFKKGETASSTPAQNTALPAFKAIDRVSVQDNVTLREGQDAIQSDRALWTVEEKKATFEGNVCLKKDEHYAKGGQAFYDQNKGVYSLSGSTGQKAKAIVRPDLGSKKDKAS